jgi:GNAT superfamily N-acetyltransferase
MEWTWRPLELCDLEALTRLAKEAHPGLPERCETFAEKRALFPPGALKWAEKDGGRFGGYAIAFPWRIGALPKLDTLFGRLPDEADCLYLHDCVIAPSARGRKASARLIERLRALAQTHGLDRLALVAVYGSDAVWSRYGFAPVDWPHARAALSGYGRDAVAMLATA